MGKHGVMMQYFEWYLKADAKHWQRVKENAEQLAKSGFSALWLPPAYKGQAGIHDVGYGAYDLYDLGEFAQKGSVPTKYGSKEEYLAAIDELHKYHIDVYADMVFNHKMGADEKEEVNAVEENPNNRNQDISNEETIYAWTKFTFPKRKGRYSGFTWNKNHFDGVDYDDRSKKTSIYRFEGKEWDRNVDLENGNYDYLMGADLSFENHDVVNELHRYGKWYLQTCHVDGFRLDALKHIENDFFKGWLDDLRHFANQELFTVGEYFSPYLSALTYYLEVNDYALSLFDVPLHYNFFQACNANATFDMRKLLDQTLVQTRAMNAVTFVENHDTQAGQALQTVILDWFKPLAYAVILLRDEGYPCVFYGDYYGCGKYQSKIFKEEIDLMMNIRKNKMRGVRHDYFDHFDIVGWTFEGIESDGESGFAVLINDGGAGEKRMYVGKHHAMQYYYDITSHIQEAVFIDADGCGLFKVDGGSYSIYVKK
ncbi:MAG: alpha-amylase [Erysipelotrichia bacterium]|nr:alpha-amylase [Erysipelotrichia bacterium]NCC54604.1 alpha-amylase [Erysipelotrichia bacterium]